MYQYKRIATVVFRYEGSKRFAVINMDSNRIQEFIELSARAGERLIVESVNPW